jgi:hypothetical protein
MIAVMLEDLDEKRLEELLKDLEQFKAKVELKKMKKNCLDVLEEIKEMVEIQKDGKTVVKEKKSEEPPKPPAGRKLYATKFGVKYHFNKLCKGFNGNPNFEKKPCSNCRAKTAKILDLSDSGSSSSTEARVKDDTLGFEVSGLHYHDEECSVY